MTNLDSRWLILAIALTVAIRPLGAIEGSLGPWLSQIALELAFAAAAWGLVGRDIWRVRIDRLGWRRGRMTRLRQVGAVLVCLLLIAATSVLFANDPQPLPSDVTGQVRLSDAQLLLSLVLLPAICEELFFRGALQRLLTLALGPVVAILAASILFGLLHVGAGPRAVLFAGTLGLCLGALTHQSGSIREAMLVHGLNNAAYFVGQAN